MLIKLSVGNGNIGETKERIISENNRPKKNKIILMENFL
jgi:hypothetical protein